MCIIVWKPEGVEISEEYIENCYRRNDDGCGMLYSENDSLHLQKGLFSLEQFLELYRRHKDKSLLMHFRIKTHGEINKQNSHPFIINSNLGFAHNGVITGLENSLKYSDSFIFNETILKTLPPGWEENSSILEFIKSFIGSSRIAVLRKDGHITLINESAGVWDNGVWYSHSGYKPYKRETYTPNKPHLTVHNTPLSSDLIVGKDTCRLCFSPIPSVNSLPNDKQLGMCYICAANFVCGECYSDFEENHVATTLTEITQSLLALGEGKCKKGSKKHNLDYLVDKYAMLKVPEKP